MPRFAVVSDLDTADLRPVGLVVERADRVILLPVDDYGLKTEYRDPYTVREPDGSDVVYRPGRPEYFDHVLVTLQRTVLVRELDAIEYLDTVGIMELFHQKVLSQQPRHAGAYQRGELAATWRAPRPSPSRRPRRARSLFRPAA